MKVKAVYSSDGRKISWVWNRGIPYVDGNSLWIRYPVDISEVPEHLAYFAFMVGFQDLLCFRGGTILVPELTEAETRMLRVMMKRVWHSHGCAGRVREYDVAGKPPVILPDRFVEPTNYDDTGGVVCCNGMGKDGMDITLLAKRLGYTPHTFTLLNQYRTEELLEDRLEANNTWHRKEGLSPGYAETNFWDIVNKKEGRFNRHRQFTGFYPYAYALVYASALNASTVLDGIQIHTNKWSICDGHLYCPGETIFHFHDVSKATGITLSSPLRPLSNYGAQRLLAYLYPEYLRYQRSCMYDIPWCCECPKCNRKALYLMELHKPPGWFGLEKYDEGQLGFENYGPVHRSVRQILAKMKGEPYEAWPYQANRHVFPHIWEGDRLREIYSECFSFYDVDPGPDGDGYTLEPSKWGDMLEH